MKKITIKIEAQYGSSFQQECAVSALKAMLLAWETHVQMRHKKNKVKVMLDEK